MKIAHIYGPVSKMHGATKWLMGFASEMSKQGHESTIYCTDFSIERPYWLQAEIVRGKRRFTLPGQIGAIVSSYINVLWLYPVVPKDADVIVFHAEVSTALIPVIRFKNKTAKLVYYCYQPPREVYDLWPILKKHYPRYKQVLLSAVLPFYKMLDKCLVRGTNCILVWGQEYEDYAKSIYGRKPRYFQLPASVDFSLFASYDENIRKEMESRVVKHEFVLLINAALTRKKNVDLFIRLIGELKQRGVDAQGIVIGEGPLEQELRELTAKLELDDRVRLTGFVSQEELPCYYVLSDILFYLEPNGAWSLSIIEAGAACKPVIVAPGGSMPTLVKHGITGEMLSEGYTLRELADRTVDLLADEGKRRFYGENGHQHCKQYSMPSAVNNFMGFVSQLR